jgi:Hypoxanthine-guanine phosphoribosyltransferase
MDNRIGDVYLSADELGTRVRELGAEIARDYDGREPILVGSLKASFVFLADLSRAMPILHGLDFVELAGYGSAQMGGHEQIRVLKDLDADISGRDVIVVEDVVDTGLTLHYLVRTFELRKPRSIAAVTLLDRPYRGSWTISPSATSASSCRTSSSSATASTSRSAGASSPISASCSSALRSSPNLG